MNLSLTKFVQRTLGVQEAVVDQVRFEDDHDGEPAVVVRVHLRPNRLPRCAACGGKVRSRGHGHRVRRWRHLSLGRMRSYLEAELRRVYCPCTGSERMEAVPWARAGARVTRPLERSVGCLSRATDVTTTARHFELSWRTVARIQERLVDEQLTPARFDGLYAIGVDEVSHRKGQQYLTVVVDLFVGDVIWIGEGRREATLAAFFEELGPERCAQLLVVATDLHRPYHNAVEKYAPQAALAFDWFHLVKGLNDALDDLRREEFRKLDQEERRWLKGTRWAILKNPGNLKSKQRAVLRDLERRNRRLYRAYLLKEEFRTLRVAGNPEATRENLQAWLCWALRCRIPQVVRFARTVRKHLQGILHAVELGVSTARVEGTNNKIKTILKKAYGFLSPRTFIRQIYFHCLEFEIV